MMKEDGYGVLVQLGAAQLGFSLDIRCMPNTFSGCAVTVCYTNIPFSERENEF